MVSHEHGKKSVLQVALLLAGFGTGLLITGLAVIIFFGYMVSDKILPGVSAGGIDLSGKSVNEAAALLGNKITYTFTGNIVLQDGTSTWLATPAKLGFFFDPESTAKEAYRVGRTGILPVRLAEMTKSWTIGVELPPVFAYDERIAQAYLIEISKSVDRPVLEAGIHLAGTEVITTPGQVGRRVDIDSTLQLLSVQLNTVQDGVIPLLIREDTPQIMDASPQAEIARLILAEPLTLFIPNAVSEDPGPWVVQRESLAGILMMNLVEVNGKKQVQVKLDEKSLRDYLDHLAIGLQRDPENARFVFNDETLQLDLMQNAVVGRSLDVEKTITEINTRTANGEHQIGLILNNLEPMVSDKSTGKDLGITELLFAERSFFYGSSSARIANIKTAASKFHGLLVAPGEEFSMAEALGDISLDNGYTEALIIYGDQTIKGVGGGVCQVSTTLFRTAFFAGFPILERYAHAYRVSYYEQTVSGSTDVRLAGLDATVFVPVVDFKFRNDTPYWLLMETYVSETSILWKFYSTKDGRTVDWSTSGPINVVKAPAAEYRENPDLPKGKIKQIDWSADGADIEVNRTVYKEGQVYLQDTFETHYTPWQAVYEYGPGTKIPKKQVEG